MVFDKVIGLLENFRRLNYKVLRRMEIEFDLLKKTHPEMADEFDNIYTRIRSGVLDDIGDLTRFIKKEFL